jgi:CBS-domain-containing membrane protein
MTTRGNDTLRRSFGAIVGTALGTLAYWLLLQRGTHALAAVGAGTALGVAAAARTRSTPWSIATAMLAVLASLAVEATFRPFTADPSFGYFVAHVADLPGGSLVSLAVVTGLGAWFGRGRVPSAPAST